MTTKRLPNDIVYLAPLIMISTGTPPALTPRAHQFNREFVQTPRAVFFNGEEVANKQPAGMALVNRAGFKPAPTHPIPFYMRPLRFLRLIVLTQPIQPRAIVPKNFPPAAITDV
ncbi:MAG: hypothetical protein M3N35_13290, partial [Candidatus Binatota bacterium]|nr:hypothetical protein [Candidatus Binatota bacterium]